MPLPERGESPAVCPNGHAMDEGYFYCPCCGAFRPSANAPTTDSARGAADFWARSWEELCARRGY